MEVSNIDGSVDVDADNGRIVLARITGSIVVNSDNGRVEGTGLSGSSVNAQSDNGRIELAFTDAPDNVVAKSDNGRIEIAVPTVDEGYDITMQSDNGSETSTGLVNDPNSPRVIRAEADNGSITIRSTG